MTLAEQWLKRPQNIWLRRALFQIHLWTGIGVGIYVLLISISGSAIVFRNEIYNAYSPKPTLLNTSGPRLTKDQLKDAAHRAHPGYAITFIWEARRADQAVEIWFEKNHSQIQRLFDPYTGQDLGPSVPVIIRTVAWLSDLHTNLLGGEKGRKINGVGSILLTVLCITGLVIWWPGVNRWRHAFSVQWKANWKRVNFDLHSAVGIWMFAFIFMWGVTGIYVVWPTLFQKQINRFWPLDYYRLVSDAPAPSVIAPAVKFVPVADEQPPQDAPRPRRRRPPPHYSTGDKIIRWFTYLHFGNFAGPKTKTLWVILGLAPVALFFTGVLMWWNRVLSKT